MILVGQGWGIAGFEFGRVMDAAWITFLYMVYCFSDCLLFMCLSCEHLKSYNPFLLYDVAKKMHELLIFMRSLVLLWVIVA